MPVLLQEYRYRQAGHAANDTRQVTGHAVSIGRHGKSVTPFVRPAG
jgi:hypothetical protein